MGRHYITLELQVKVSTLLFKRAIGSKSKLSMDDKITSTLGKNCSGFYVVRAGPLNLR